MPTTPTALEPTPTPDDPDGDRRFRQQLTEITAWLAIAGLLLANAFDVAFGNPLDPVRLQLHGLMAASAAFAIWLLRRGQLQLPAQLLLWSLLAGTTALAAVTGGPRAPALIIYLVPVALATRILGGRYAIAMAVASALALFGLAWLASAGLLPPDRFIDNAYRRVVTPALVIAILGVLWYFVGEEVAMRINRLREGRERLARSEAQLQLVVGNIAVMMAYFDAQDRCLWANDAYARDKGVAPDALVGRRLEDILRPGEYTEQMRHFVERATAGERLSYLRETTGAAGNPRFIQVDLTPDRGPDGSIRGRIVAQRDVTEERGRERLLDVIATGTASASGDEFFRALTEHLARALGVRHAMLAEFIDADTRARALAFRDGDAFAPPFTYTLAGAPCELIRKKSEVYFERDVAQLFPADEPLARRGIQGYYGLALCDRAGRVMGLLAIMDIGPLAISEQTRSVMRIFATRAAMELERQRAEQAIEGVRRQFETVFRSSPAAMSIFTLDEGRFVDCNDAYLALLGRKREQVIGRTGLELGIWHDPLQRDEAFALRERGVAVSNAECDLVTGTGGLIHCMYSWTEIEIKGARYLLAHVVDLTERKRAERALRDSEARFQDFAQASGDWFWETDAEGRFTWFSDASGNPASPWKWIYGKTRAELAAGPPDLSAEPWKSHLEALARQEPFRDFVYQREDDDGERWTRASGMPQFDADGRFVGYRGAASDITARVLAEREAHQAGARLRTAIEQLDEGFALWDADDRLVICNRRYEEFSGVPQLVRPGVAAETLLRAQVAAGYVPEAVGRETAWVEERLAARREATQDGEMKGGEIRRGDRWYIANNQRLPDGALVTILIDFTGRKLAEDSLRASQQRFEALFRASPTPAVIFTVTGGVILDCNSAYCTLLGNPREHAIGRTGRELNLYRDPADRDRLIASMSAAGRVSPVELDLVKASGEHCSVLGFLELVDWPGHRAVMAQLLDVTKQKQADVALRESRQRFAALFEESVVPQLVSNPATRVNEDANRAFCELVGYPRERIVGSRGQDIDIFWSDADRILVTGSMPTGPQSSAVVEVRLRRSDGTQRIALVSGCLIRLETGTQVAWSVIDVTDRSLAESALRESEEQFQSMFSDSPAAQSVIDAATLEYVNVNPAWSELTGYPAGEVLGHPGQSIELFSAESRTALGGRLEREGRVLNAEVSMRRRDGSLRRCLLSGRRITSKGRPLNVWWSIDVTAERAAWRRIEEMNASLERTVAGRTAELQKANAGLKAALEGLKSSQEALLRSEKLAALGRLVAGVAHELNTPIGNSLLSATTLHEHTEAFAMEAGSGSLRRSALESFVAQSREASGILMRNLGKAAELISSFKQVAADQTSSQRRGFSLDEVVNEVLLAHRPMLKTSPIKIELEVPAGIRMDSYPGPLGQVLGNLITNAVLHGYEGHAHGTVTVSARRDGEDAVEIAVLDHGRGISEADLKRIFDPFFTTKLGRGGTGLGLGICHNIVTGSLGGSVRVSSRPGHGASFMLNLPLTAPRARSDREAA